MRWRRSSRAAKAKGIPVVFVDTKGINEGITFIGTQQRSRRQARRRVHLLEDRKGIEVAILQGIITQSTGQARANGAKAGA